MKFDRETELKLRHICAYYPENKEKIDDAFDEAMHGDSMSLKDLMRLDIVRKRGYYKSPISCMSKQTYQNTKHRIKVCLCQRFGIT
jgi:hypothetical protein